MKNFILIGCLIGSIFTFTEDSGHKTATFPLITGSIPVKAEISVDTANKIRFTPMSLPAATENIKATEESNGLKTVKQKFAFQTVNGISLYDDPSSVIDKLGEPAFITEDPHIPGIEIYQYPNMNVVFSDGIVNFVEIMDGTKTLQLDGIEIPATIEALEAALGHPDYITEDGIVFERNEALLKLFIDADTKKLTSIHYFHSLSM